MISIIIPVYKPNIQYLQECLDSIENQAFPKAGFEIVVVKDGPQQLDGVNWGTVRIIEAPRGGIGATMNRGFREAKGDLLCWVDQDDFISPYTLLEVQNFFNRRPEVDLIYTSESIKYEGTDGWSCAVKTPFDFLKLLQQNYLCHLVVFRKRVFEKVQFPEDKDGIQDHKFLIDVAMNSFRIEHVPAILYCWRIHGKNYHKTTTVKIEQLGMEMIKETLYKVKPLNWKVELHPFLPITYRFYAPLEREPKVLIVTLTKTEALIKKCLEKVEGLTYKNKKTAVVVGGQIPIPKSDYFFQKNETFNFSKFNNFTIKEVSKVEQFDYYLFLNDDVELDPQALTEMIKQAETWGAGIVGAKLLYPNGTIQHAGIIGGVHPGHLFWKKDANFSGANLVSAALGVTAACMLISKKVYEALGGFNELYETELQDVELCYKYIDTGGTILYTPYAVGIHKERTTRGIDEKILEHAPDRKRLKVLVEKMKTFSPFSVERASATRAFISPKGVSK